MACPLLLHYYITPSVCHGPVTITYEIRNLSSDSFKKEIVLVDSLLGSYHYGRLKLQPKAVQRINLRYTMTARDFRKKRLIGTGFIIHKKRISNVASDSVDLDRSAEFNLQLAATLDSDDVNIINLRINILNLAPAPVMRNLTVIFPTNNSTFPLGNISFGPNESKSFSHTYTLSEVDHELGSYIIKGFITLSKTCKEDGLNKSFIRISNNNNKVVINASACKNTDFTRISNIASVSGILPPPSPCLNPPVPGVDWSGCDKTGLVLVNADVSFGTFIRTIFTQADLSGTNFSNAILTETNLIGANLTNTNFMSALLTLAILSTATLISANLTDANLVLATVIYADLTNANLSNANASGVNLAFSNLTGANLSNANLTGANLANATLVNTNLTETDLTDAILDGVISSNIIGIPASLPPGWSLIDGTLVFTG